VFGFDWVWVWSGVPGTSGFSSSFVFLLLFEACFLGLLLGWVSCFGLPESFLILCRLGRLSGCVSSCAPILVACLGG